MTGFCFSLPNLEGRGKSIHHQHWLRTSRRQEPLDVQPARCSAEADPLSGTDLVLLISPKPTGICRGAGWFPSAFLQKTYPARPQADARPWGLKSIPPLCRDTGWAVRGRASKPAIGELSLYGWMDVGISGTGKSEHFQDGSLYLRPCMYSP